MISVLSLFFGAKIVLSIRINNKIAMNSMVVFSFKSFRDEHIRLRAMVLASSLGSMDYVRDRRSNCGKKKNNFEWNSIFEAEKMLKKIFLFERDFFGLKEICFIRKTFFRLKNIFLLKKNTFSEKYVFHLSAMKKCIFPRQT